MQRYGLLLNDAGTIKDDFMFSRLQARPRSIWWSMPATKEGDFAYIGEKLAGRGDLDAALRARACWRCKGRGGGRCWSVIAPASASLTFMQVVRADVAGAPAIVSRTGYTGEDGFEISLEGEDAERVARALLER